jgi:hypothetical protein
VTNPEWSAEPKKRKIRKIMNQRANSAADLAMVLFIHRKLGHEMTALQRRRVREQQTYLRKKWPELKALAGTSEEKLAALKKTILDSEKLRKETVDEKEAASLKLRLIAAHKRLKKIQWAKKLVTQHDNIVSKFLAAKPKSVEPKAAEPKAADSEAPEPEATETASKPARFTKKEKKALAAVPEIEKPLVPLPEPITPLPEGLVQKILPATLKSWKSPPYTIEGVECKWADLIDPQYAAKWPQEMKGHALLREVHTKVLTEDEYNARALRVQRRVDQKAREILKEMKFEAENKRRVEKGLPRLKRAAKKVKVAAGVVAEQAKPAGLMRFMPGFIANRFGGKRATA